MGYKRFPIPEFNRDELKGMEWHEPNYLSAEEIAGLYERQKAGDASVYGCYAVMPSEDFFARLDVRGEYRHAVMCVLPDKAVKVTGRSYAWAIQRMWLIDSLDPETGAVLIDWKTPRPINTRLGPEAGATVGGGVLYAVSAHAYGDHWIANRTIADNAWQQPGADYAFRILSASDERANNFHDCNLHFEWNDEP